MYQPAYAGDINMKNNNNKKTFKYSILYKARNFTLSYVMLLFYPVQLTLLKN